MTWPPFSPLIKSPSHINSRFHATSHPQQQNSTAKVLFAIFFFDCATRSGYQTSFNPLFIQIPHTLSDMTHIPKSPNGAKAKKIPSSGTHSQPIPRAGIRPVNKKR